jgi:hypothetical protein
MALPQGPLDHRYQGEHPVRTLVYLFRKDHARLVVAVLAVLLVFGPLQAGERLARGYAAADSTSKSSTPSAPQFQPGVATADIRADADVRLTVSSGPDAPQGPVPTNDGLAPPQPAGALAPDQGESVDPRDLPSTSEPSGDVDLHEENGHPGGNEGCVGIDLLAIVDISVCVPHP